MHNSEQSLALPKKKNKRKICSNFSISVQHLLESRKNSEKRTCRNLKSVMKNRRLLMNDFWMQLISTELLEPLDSFRLLLPPCTLLDWSKSPKRTILYPFGDQMDFVFRANPENLVLIATNQSICAPAFGLQLLTYNCNKNLVKAQTCVQEDSRVPCHYENFARPNI